MPAANVIQLRAMLSEKFPGVRMRLGKTAENQLRPTAVPQLDEPLHGGVPKGALTEIVSQRSHDGSATLLRALLHQTGRQNQIMALIDGSDSLEVTHLSNRDLARLLWVRCHSANEAMKAADLVLRDGNLPFVLLDLKFNGEKELRKIPATTWYRFQRLAEETGAVCLVFTPRPMLSPAQARFTLQSQLSLSTLEQDADEVMHGLKLALSEQHQRLETPPF